MCETALTPPQDLTDIIFGTPTANAERANAVVAQLLAVLEGLARNLVVCETLLSTQFLACMDALLLRQAAAAVTRAPGTEPTVGRWRDALMVRFRASALLRNPRSPCLRPPP